MSNFAALNFDVRKSRKYYLPLFFSIFVFLLIEFLEYISPFSYAAFNIEYYINFGIFFSIYFIFLIPFLGKRFKAVNLGIHSHYAKKLASNFLYASLLGVLFVIFDRVVFQGVNYSAGINAARTVWQEGVGARQGVSSPLSVLGNLFYPLCFISYLISLIFFEEKDGFGKNVMLSFLLIAVFSIIIGGKTEVLVFVAINISVMLTRIISGKSALPSGFVFPLFVLFGFSSVMIYIIFEGRMSSSTVGFQLYVESLVTRHYGEITEGYSPADPLLVFVFDAILVYFLHVKWVLMDAMNNIDSLYGNSFFNQFFSILETRAKIDLNYFGYLTDWTYSGLWLSFVGTAWHDFGLSGVVIVSLVVSLIGFNFNLKFSSLSRVANSRMVMNKIIAFVLFNSFLLMSPYASLFSVVSFIYLIFVFYLLRMIFVFLRLSTKSSLVMQE